MIVYYIPDGGTLLGKDDGPALGQRTPLAMTVIHSYASDRTEHHRRRRRNITTALRETRTRANGGTRGIRGFNENNIQNVLRAIRFSNSKRPNKNKMKKKPLVFYVFFFFFRNAEKSRRTSDRDANG